MTDRFERIKNSVKADPFYREDYISRVIEFDEFSIVKMEYSTLRRDRNVDWVIYNDNGDDVADFPTLHEAKQYAKSKRNNA